MNKNATPRQGEPNSSIWVVILLAIVLTAIMLLAVSGGTMFSSISENRSGNMDRRAALSYVSARVLASDEKDAIKVEEGKDSSILKIGTKVLFLKDGYLKEGNDTEDKDARTVAKTSEFEATLDSRLLTITTDEGTREIYLHSEEAAS